MFHDPLSSVYKIDGLYPDPYGVIQALKTTPKEHMQEMVDAVKAGNLDTNPNVLKEITRFEYDRDMSS